MSTDMSTFCLCFQLILGSDYACLTGLLCLVPDHTLEISDQIKINKKVKKQIQSFRAWETNGLYRRANFLEGLCQPMATFFCSRCLYWSKNPERQILLVFLECFFNFYLILVRNLSWFLLLTSDKTDFWILIYPRGGQTIKVLLDNSQRTAGDCRIMNALES